MKLVIMKPTLSSEAERVRKELERIYPHSKVERIKTARNLFNFGLREAMNFVEGKAEGLPEEI